MSFASSSRWAILAGLGRRPPWHPVQGISRAGRTRFLTASLVGCARPKVENNMSTEAKCPVSHTPRRAPSNKDWWPNQLSLKVLHQHSSLSDPMGEGLQLRRGIQSARPRGREKDLAKVMTDSQDWWPADFGHYGPLFIRMSWHSRRVLIARRRTRRRRTRQPAFCPAQQLARQRQPGQGAPAALAVKQKYGRKISWADLLVLAGNVALWKRWGSRPLVLAADVRTSGSPKRMSTGARNASGWAAMCATHGSEGVEKEGAVFPSDDADGDIHSRGTWRIRSPRSRWG
jgi:hypothetical protein